MQADIQTLDGCMPMRQALEARPPVVLHMAAWGLVTLLMAALAWSACTPADLVIRATGRIRPTTPPVRMFAPVASKLENRVATVRVQEGSFVRAGDVLLTFETERIANEISRLQREIATKADELGRMEQLRQRLDQQLDAVCIKLESELSQARSETVRAQLLQQSEVALAEAELWAAQDKLRRTELLFEKKVATESERIIVTTQVRCAERKLAMARTPLAQTRMETLERQLEVDRRDHEVRLAELEERRTAKQGEVEVASKDLANLELQLRQATVTSPIEGVVLKGQHHAGDLIEPGKVVFEVASPDHLCFEANVASEDVGRVRNEMGARIKFDAFDYQRYGTLPGGVTFIAPDSSRPVNATHSDPVYVVRVSLAQQQLVRGDLRGEIKLGMTGHAEIVTDRRTILQIIVQRIRSSISLG
jgi:HlyD family secretion protein